MVGILGPIASGKSAVTDQLERLGAGTIRADVVSRELLQPGSELLQKIIEEFGEEFARPDGSLDRRALGAAILAEDAARRRLEQIVHPPMIDSIARRVCSMREECAHRVIAIEAANLVQMGALPLVDRTVLVTAPREIRLRRLMDRDKIDRERAEALLELHDRLGIEQFTAEFVIDTRGDIDETARRAERLWRHIVEHGERSR